MAILLAIVGVSELLTGAGLIGALIQKEKISENHYSSVLIFNLAISLFIVFIFQVYAEAICIFLNIEGYETSIKTICFIFIIKSFTSVHDARLRKNLEFKTLSKIGFISALLSGVAAIALASNDFGIDSLIYQLLIQSSIVMIYLNVKFFKKNLVRPSYKALLSLWGFGFNIFIANLIDKIVSSLDTVVLSKVVPLAEVGFFHRAKSLNAMVFESFSSSVMAITFPYLSQKQNNKNELVKSIYKINSLLSIITAFLVGYVFLETNNIILFLLGDKWEPTIYFAKFLIITSLFHHFITVNINILTTQGYSKAYLKFILLRRCLSVLALFVLYYKGIEFYLYAILFQGILECLLSVVFCKSYVKVKMNNNLLVFIKYIFIMAFTILIAKILLSNIKVSTFIELIVGFLLYTLTFISLLIVVRDQHLYEIKKYFRKNNKLY